MAITKSQLAKAQARYEAARQRAEDIRENRDELIRRAAADGWSQERIAQAMGLVRTRITQIAPRGKRP